MSIFVRNSQQHFSLTQEEAEKIFFNCLKEINNEDKLLSNKEIVSLLKKILKENGHKVPQQKIYENLSMMMGWKNYNIALAKRVEFHEIFFKHSYNFLTSVFDGKGVSFPSPYNLEFIPTGISPLDQELKGGIYKKQVSAVVAGTNKGKTKFVQSLAANAIKNNPNIKVLHIQLEGLKAEAVINFLSNFSNKSLREVLLNSNELTSLPEITSKKSQLVVKNMSFLDLTIEDLEEEIARIHETFKFDLLIIDYPQLLNSKTKAIDFNSQLSYIWERLTFMANVFNCAVLVPVQSSRGQKINEINFPSKIQLKSHVVLNLDRSAEDASNNKMKVFLGKNPRGECKLTYEIITNFDVCNLITGWV